MFYVFDLHHTRTHPSAWKNWMCTASAPPLVLLVQLPFRLQNPDCGGWGGGGREGGSGSTGHPFVMQQQVPSGNGSSQHVVHPLVDTASSISRQMGFGMRDDLCSIDDASIFLLVIIFSRKWLNHETFENISGGSPSSLAVMLLQLYSWSWKHPFSRKICNYRKSSLFIHFLGIFLGL